MLLYRYGAGGTVGQWRRSSVVGAAPRALVLAKRARRPSALDSARRTNAMHTHGAEDTEAEHDRKDAAWGKEVAHGGCKTP